MNQDAYHSIAFSRIHVPTHSDETLARKGGAGEREAGGREAGGREAGEREADAATTCTNRKLRESVPASRGGSPPVSRMKIARRSKTESSCVPST